MSITYISFKRGILTAQSDLSILKLHPDSISFIGNQLVVSKSDCFDAVITFPCSDEGTLKLLDEEFRDANHTLRSFVNYL